MNAEERYDHEPGWAVRNRWKLVLALAAVAGGRLVGPAATRAGASAVEPVSEHWLAEHMFESGQRPNE